MTDEERDLARRISNAITYADTIITIGVNPDNPHSFSGKLFSEGGICELIIAEYLRRLAKELEAEHESHTGDSDIRQEASAQPETLQSEFTPRIVRSGDETS